MRGRVSFRLRIATLLGDKWTEKDGLEIALAVWNLLMAGAGIRLAAVVDLILHKKFRTAAVNRPCSNVLFYKQNERRKI